MKVIIVGGGLVGSLCGCYLGMRGHEVAIYEYRNDPRGEKVTRGRSINLALSTRGLEALARVGLDQAVKKSTIPMKGRMLHPLHGSRHSVPYDPVHNMHLGSVERALYFNSGESREKQGILFLWFQSGDDPGDLDEPSLKWVLAFTGQEWLGHSTDHTTPIVCHMVTKLEAEKYDNVCLRFNHKIVSVNLEEKEITFTRTDKNNSNQEKDTADLIIGADGAYSIVRREMMKQPMFNYSQTYIEHGYIELSIPPENNFMMEPNHLHIWPRGSFMLIALPNNDGSWTVTLFMPLTKFEQLLGNIALIKQFFDHNFPDALRCIGESALIKQFTRPSYLISVKCSRYNFGDKAVIIGDAAHAMVPFFGQGMNAGFEDCRLLDELLHGNMYKLKEALEEFSKTRVIDAHTICDLAMYNYIEMRDLVIKPSYIIRKKLDNWLYWTFSGYWIPLYQSVTFTNTPYHECLKNKSWQDSVLKKILYLSGTTLSSSFIYFLWDYCSQTK